MSARARAKAMGVALGLGLFVSGCTDELEPDPQDNAAADARFEPDSERAGVLRVVLQPRLTELTVGSRVRIEARFAEYRGVSASDPRVLGLPDSAVTMRDARDACMAVTADQLQAASSAMEMAGAAGRADESTLSSTESMTGSGGPEREVSLLDAGDLRVHLGRTLAVVPLVLVPDLVRWVSGVEYRLVDDAGLEALREPDAVGRLRFEFGGGGDEIPAFELVLEQTPVPEILAAGPLALPRLLATQVEPGANGALSRSVDPYRPGADTRKESPPSGTANHDSLTTNGGDETPAAQDSATPGESLAPLNLDRLGLRWSTKGALTSDRERSEPLLVEIVAVGEVGMTGATILCSLADDGTALLSWSDLIELGLGDGHELLLTTRRIRHGAVDGGGMPLEWSIESRDQVLLAIPGAD